MKPTKHNISKNKFFSGIITIYILLLLFTSTIACYFSYEGKKEEFFSAISNTFVQLDQEYQHTVDNFWQVYMPLYSKNNSASSVLFSYFASEPNSENLEPMERVKLKELMEQLLMQNEDIKWIAFYSLNRDINYILYQTNKRFETLPNDFPYLHRMKNKKNQMEIYGAQSIYNGTSYDNTYAICGGLPTGMKDGSIIVGYDTSRMKQICEKTPHLLNSLRFTLSFENDILFDSAGTYDVDLSYLPQETTSAVLSDSSGEKFFVQSETIGNKFSLLTATVSWKEFFLKAHHYTPIISMVVLLFAVISITLYFIMMHFITKEVSIIKKGLNIISENNLDFQLPTVFHQSGLPEIAVSINYMTKRLKENINRAYYYELKQKDAELSELQSKFNPHFLYNTLEMLRAKSSQNGDFDTAELIAQLAAIFRGFIGSKTFIPLGEELAFTRRYLSLFQARYGENVQILYDIDTDLLPYGIIRNIFQPLIENYFIHGFDSSETNNYILIKGKSIDKQTMILSVEDNGIGMDRAHIQALNEKLHEPLKNSSESYGLKNLHQRLSLFYGDGCGLTIFPNTGKGISIQLKVLKMTCEEYKNYRKNWYSENL